MNRRLLWMGILFALVLPHWAFGEEGDIGVRVITIVVQQLGATPETITESTSFIDDLGADELDIVELVRAFEKEFGCDVPDGATKAILTVGGTIKYFQTCKGKSPRAATPNVIAQDISDADFESAVLNSKRPVVVHFWAEWCGPCRMIASALDEFAATMNREVKIVKLNVDENSATPEKYNIMSIPTLMLFKNGGLASSQVGASPKRKLEQWIRASTTTMKRKYRVK
jgi:thioredoxin 1